MQPRVTDYYKMDLSKEKLVHRIIERIEEQQRRIQEERIKRHRGEPYLTEDQVRVEVAIKYMQVDASQRAGACPSRTQPQRQQRPLLSSQLH